MAKKNEYVAWLCEQLAPLGSLRVKSMFGGYGLYCDELFFAIIYDDMLFLKADSMSEAEWVAQGLEQFTYELSNGRIGAMKYYMPPEAALEDQQELLVWARKALAAALRAPARKKKWQKSNA
ncbi:TfoX/Sxy family protein [Glaciimonas soli]|uniref:Transcriptional regulator n=1 Tax=Glaciimonas soli TaxID=2590999 RepID=A0A843Z0D4_9BURK|nr:TfoX/Sxy family protein [Glaciimonas soli]MQR02286.1 transcriptional regulator [Glaciimonas soli]